MPGPGRSRRGARMSEILLLFLVFFGAGVFSLVLELNRVVEEDRDV